MADIHITQAINQFPENNRRNQEAFNEVMEEIKISDFSMLSFLDVQHYADKLNEYNPDRKAKKFKANDVRELNVKAGNSRYDMINSFVDSDSDDIFDFF